MILDWRDPAHHDPGPARPCRVCGRPTPLRDGRRRPCHKTCAEQELTDQAAEAVATYRRRR